MRAGETSSAGVVRLAGLPLDRAIWVLIEKEGFLPELRSVMLSRRVTCPEIGITLRPGRTAEGQRLDVRLPEESYPYLPDFLLEWTGRDDQEYVHWSELEAPAGPETRRQGHAVVTGRVMAPDGAPISGAVLFAGGDNSVEAVSAADGSFRLEGLSSGQVPVVARAAGFHGGTKTLEVAGDQARVDFALTPGEEAITLRGRVLSAAGAPVEGTAVWINNLLVHSTRDGSFTLVLPSHWKARWEITAEKDGFGRGRTSFDVLGKCMTGIEIRLAARSEMPVNRRQ